MPASARRRGPESTCAPWSRGTRTRTGTSTCSRSTARGHAVRAPRARRRPLRAAGRPRCVLQAQRDAARRSGWRRDRRGAHRSTVPNTQLSVGAGNPDGTFDRAGELRRERRLGVVRGGGRERRPRSRRGGRLPDRRHALARGPGNRRWSRAGPAAGGRVLRRPRRRGRGRDARPAQRRGRAPPAALRERRRHVRRVVRLPVARHPRERADGRWAT